MPDQRPDRQSRKPLRPFAGPGGLKFGRGVFGWVLFIGLAIMLFVLLRQQQSNTQEFSWSEVRENLQAGKIRTITIGTDELTGELNTSTAPNVPAKFHTPLQPNMIDSNLLQWLTDNRGTTEIKVSNNQNLIIQML